MVHLVIIRIAICSSFSHLRLLARISGGIRRWTNDALRATPHQVVDLSHRSEIIPERYSIAFFCNANKDVTLDPSDLSFVGSGEPAKYPPINALEYLTKRLSDTIAK